LLPEQAKAPNMLQHLFSHGTKIRKESSRTLFVAQFQVEITGTKKNRSENTSV
jgi:hypothetical protein